MKPQLAQPSTIAKSLLAIHDADTHKILLWVSHNKAPCDIVLQFNRNERYAKGFQKRRSAVIDSI